MKNSSTRQIRLTRVTFSQAVVYKRWMARCSPRSPVFQLKQKAQIKTFFIVFLLNLFYSFITYDRQKSNKQRAKSNEQQAKKRTSNKQKVTSYEQKVTSNKQKPKSNEQNVQPRELQVIARIFVISHFCHDYPNQESLKLLAVICYAVLLSD